jgi:general secretion pathway protein D
MAITVVIMTRNFCGIQQPALRVGDWICSPKRFTTAAVLICSLCLAPSTAMAQFAPQAPPATDPSNVSDTIVAGYPIGDRDVREVTRQLHEQFGNRSDVRIVQDARTGRILVQAPADVHRQLQEQFLAPAASLSAPASEALQAPGPRGTTPRATPPTSAQWDRPERREVADQLHNMTWRQLIAAAQQISTNQLSLTPDTNGQDLTATLPSRQGETVLRINTQTGAFRLEGTPQLTQSWLDAIRALDQRSTAQSTHLVPIGDVSPQSIDRAVELLQSAQRGGNSPAARWGADVIGIRPANRSREQLPAQLTQAPGQQPDQLPADDQPIEAPPEETDPEAGEEVGVDGSLIGPVQIEYVEGLDAIIIRGRKADVDRVMRIIDELERLGLEGPAIELVELQHVNSESMAEVVTQVNAEAITVRLGAVSITPLVKPNALMLIGRKESVDATIELIRRLDQPVAPTSQFSIFRLRHLPATDAVQTINAFFAERGGLGPRIQLQADFRTNSIIVYASPRDMQEVRQLLQEIDVTENAATSEVRVFKLRNALAEELAPMLEATLRGESAPAPAAAAQDDGVPGAGPTPTGTSARSATLTMTRIDAETHEVLRSGILTEVRVAADVRANSLIVSAPAESMELIAALVKQLDELPTSEAFVKVFTIVRGDSLSLMTMLEELFGIQQQQAQQGPATSATGAGESSLVPLRFSTDARTNSIIATGSAADLGVVEAILLRLDEDDISQRQSQIYRLQNAPALEVANAINQLLQSQRQITLQLAPETVSPFQQIEREVVVVPEVVSNSLIISATPRYFQQIVALVEELDEQPPMVLIQVLIASVRLDNLSELGMELGLQDSLLFDRSVVANNVLVPGFNFNNSPLGNSSSPASQATRNNVAGQGITSLGVGRTNADLGYGGLVLSASSESVNLLIRALQQTNRLDILSRPEVMTLNNQPAFVQVGQQVPIVQSTSLTQFGQTNSVTLTNVGILLGVTPRISPDGLVVMEIDAEKSELSSQGVPISISAEGDVLEQPIIDTTRAQTTVSARNGQTVILGGLITKTRDTLSSSVPYLGDIPLLGNLFRFDSVAEQRTELLIIMTPFIVRSPEDADVLNQIETQRMSWCLADVFDVHGDIGPGVGGLGGVPASPQVIHPDETPTANELTPPSEEIPDAARPPVPPNPPADFGPPSSTWEPEGSLPIQQPLTGKSAPRSSSSSPATNQQTQRRWRDRWPFGRSRNTPLEAAPAMSDNREVAPVQYLKPRTEPTSWEPDRRRLPSTD